MQDTDGRVWADVGGGRTAIIATITGPTMLPGTPDDRYLSPAKPGLVQAMFTALQAMYAQQFHASPGGYGAQCLNAAKRCWDASPHQGATLVLGWWTLAAIELHRATRDEQYRKAAGQLASTLAGLQHTGAIGGQNKIRGFWPASPGNPEPYREAVHGALPTFALLEAARAFPRLTQPLRAGASRRGSISMAA